jgi:hypothetical protein
MASTGMCRPSGTRLLLLTLPGTSVPGYRLFRPSGTGSLPLQRRPSNAVFKENLKDEKMYLSGVRALSFTGRNNCSPVGTEQPVARHGSAG